MATQDLSDCVRFVEHNQMNDNITFYKICLQNKLSHSFHLKDLVLMAKLKTRWVYLQNHERNLNSKRNSMIVNKLTNNY